jgi:fructosamine-3-kinase
MDPNPRIAFTNQPKLSGFDVDRKFDDRRASLIPQIKDFLESHDRFKDKNVAVTFSHNGVSSLVCILESGGEKVILKIPLRTDRASSEPMFLKVWEQAGVKVPHVYEEGKIGDHSYALMEFVDAPLLSELYSSGELEERKIYSEMGQALRKMHTPEANGFGRVIDSKAEFETFKDWLSSDYIKERVDYIKENNLLTEEHGSLSKVFETLETFIGDRTVSSYCHFDFGAGNMFGTDPITIFDPNPEFNHRFIDLGRTLAIHIAGGISPSQLITGYFSDDEYSPQAIQASIVLNAVTKFPYWNKKKKQKHIQNLQSYLLENKHLLEA